MATNAAAITPDAEPDDKIDPNAEPAAQESSEPTPYDELAQKIGWVPKDQFQGDPEQWKPAEQFILDGRDIQRTTAAELKALRSTVETIGKTSATIVEQEVSRRTAELTDRYNAAVEDGNATEAFKLASEIHKVQATPAPTANAPGAEALNFADRNKAWFQKDALATATAVDICNRLAAQGYDNATQLDAAEKEVKRLYPHLFGAMNGKPAPGVNAPGQRAPQGQGSREKGFADMPADAQKVANDMIARGVIKADPAEAKKRFAENYWLNAKGPA